MKAHNLDQKRRGVIMLMAFIMTFILVDCAVINREESREHHEEHSRQKRGLFDLADMGSSFQSTNMVQNVKQLFEGDSSPLKTSGMNIQAEPPQTHEEVEDAGHHSSDEESFIDKIKSFSKRTEQKVGQNFIAPVAKGSIENLQKVVDHYTSKKEMEPTNSNLAEDVLSQVGINLSSGKDSDIGLIQNLFSELFGQGSDHGSLDGLLKGISGKIGILSKNHDHFSDNHQSKELIGVVKNKLSELVKLKKQYGKGFLNSHSKECNQLLTEINFNCDLILNPQSKNHEGASSLGVGHHSTGGTFGQTFLNLDFMGQCNFMKDKMSKLIGLKSSHGDLNGLLSKVSEKLNQLSQRKDFHSGSGKYEKEFGIVTDCLSKLWSLKEKYGEDVLNTHSNECNELLTNISKNCDLMLHSNNHHDSTSFGGHQSVNGGSRKISRNSNIHNQLNQMYEKYLTLIGSETHHGRIGGLLTSLKKKLSQLCSHKDHGLEQGNYGREIGILGGKLDELVALHQQHGNSYLESQPQCTQILTDIENNVDGILTKSSNQIDDVQPGNSQYKESVDESSGANQNEGGVAGVLNNVFETKESSESVDQKSDVGPTQEIDPKVLEELFGKNPMESDENSNVHSNSEEGSENSSQMLTKKSANSGNSNTAQSEEPANAWVVLPLSNGDTDLSQHSNNGQDETEKSSKSFDQKSDVDPIQRIDPKILEKVFGQHSMENNMNSNVHSNSGGGIENNSQMLTKKSANSGSLNTAQNEEPVNGWVVLPLSNSDKDLNQHSNNRQVETEESSESVDQKSDVGPTQEIDPKVLEEVFGKNPMESDENSNVHSNSEKGSENSSQMLTKKSANSGSLSPAQSEEPANAWVVLPLSNGDTDLSQHSNNQQVQESINVGELESHLSNEDKGNQGSVAKKEDKNDSIGHTSIVKEETNDQHLIGNSEHPDNSLVKESANSKSLNTVQSEKPVNELSSLPLLNGNTNLNQNLNTGQVQESINVGGLESHSNNDDKDNQGPVAKKEEKDDLISDTSIIKKGPNDQHLFGNFEHPENLHVNDNMKQSGTTSNSASIANNEHGDHTNSGVVSTDVLHSANNNIQQNVVKETVVNELGDGGQRERSSTKSKSSSSSTSLIRNEDSRNSEIPDMKPFVSSIGQNDVNDGGVVNSYSSSSSVIDESGNNDRVPEMKYLHKHIDYKNQPFVNKQNKIITKTNIYKNTEESEDSGYDEPADHSSGQSRSTSYSSYSSSDTDNENSGVKESKQRASVISHEKDDNHDVSKNQNIKYVITKSSTSSSNPLSSNGNEHIIGNTVVHKKKKKCKVDHRSKPSKDLESLKGKTKDSKSKRHVRVKMDQSKKQGNDVKPSIAELENIISVYKEEGKDNLHPHHIALVKGVSPKFLQELLSLQVNLDPSIKLDCPCVTNYLNQPLTN